LLKNARPSGILLILPLSFPIPQRPYSYPAKTLLGGCHKMINSRKYGCLNKLS
jgi:hypothetical protein